MSDWIKQACIAGGIVGIVLFLLSAKYDRLFWLFIPGALLIGLAVFVSLRTVLLGS